MNRLVGSLSPYLLQHQHNPVDWFPWGDEAFEIARERDKPVFLSVGYAACHWCHVMERESFESESIAKLLNDNFVSIKVDREERPDIDQIYMNAVQVMTGQGGWPMSVFLNHQREPFFAGTYWPPQQRFGMPGFAQVLQSLADAWNDRRKEVDEHAGKIGEALQQLARGTKSTSQDEELNAQVIDEAIGRLLESLDRTDGGFGGAPKFPHVTDLELLLQLGATREESEWIDAAAFTLDRMAAGGIRDHIGGGFARYSVDAKWLVPHFEKMLYDNALLAEAYLHANQVTGQQRHAIVAREILDYLVREMTDRDGGFHCSEDADSEGVEGKYYVWTPEQVANVLGPERTELFCKVYDITEAGNFEGNSIPNLPVSIANWAAELSMSVEDLSSQLSECCEKLRVARDTRVHPGRDDKVLTSWNCLAVKALATGGAVLDEPRYLQAAERAARFVIERMTQANGRLLHAFRDGQAHLDAYVDDYAYTIEALVALFEATGQPSWIEQAVNYAEQMLEHFEDREAGGFYYSADDGEQLIARTKDWHDGSLVSGNASAARGLLKLAGLCDRDDFRVAAMRTLGAGAEIMQHQSAACAALLLALDQSLNAREQWVIALPNDHMLRQLRRSFFATFRPHLSLSWNVGEPSDEGQSLVAINQSRNAIDGEVTLYRCENFTCDAPLSGDAAVQALTQAAK